MNPLDMNPLDMSYDSPILPFFVVFSYCACFILIAAFINVYTASGGKLAQVEVSR